MIWRVLFGVNAIYGLLLGVWRALFGIVTLYGPVRALAGVRRLVFISLDF